MKKIILTLTLLAIIAGGCRNTAKKQAINENNPVCQKDTLIRLSETHGILYLRYNKDMELWYDPCIIDFSHNDTLNIKNFEYENGSDLFISVSPDKRYAVVSNIIKGYLHVAENDSILHENYKCELIDLENAVSLVGWQSACGGEWDENSNWIYGGEIQFP
jgi:hypothetical protein